MFKKYFFIVIVMAVVVVFGGLFYWFWLYDHEEIVDSTDIYTPSQPILEWQEITIKESGPKKIMQIKMPRIIIYSNYHVENDVNQAIKQRIESINDYFINVTTMVAEDNGETNILNIETEILLATPNLISLAFTSTRDLAGINYSDQQRTFLIFDLVNNKVMIEGAELFPNEISWARAVTIMKKVILSDYQGDPNCDLFFAPKQNGFSMSCIGVDYSLGGKQISLTKDIPISMVQEFLTPSVLSDVTQ